MDARIEGSHDGAHAVGPEDKVRAPRSPDDEDRFAAHVIPTGIARKPEGGYRMRGTIVFRPLPGKNGKKFDKWPSWIASEYRDLRIQMLARDAPPEQCKSFPFETRLHTLSRTSAGGEPSKEIVAGLDKLWKALLGHALADTRRILAQPGATGIQFDDVLQPPAPAEPEAKPTPDVIAPALGPAALLLSLRRAKDIYDTIKAGCDPNACQDLKQRQQASFQKHVEGTYFQRPWSRQPTPLEQLALYRSPPPATGTIKTASLEGTYELAETIVPEAQIKPRKYNPHRYGKTDPSRSDWEEVGHALETELRHLDQCLYEILKKDRDDAKKLAGNFYRNPADQAQADQSKWLSSSNHHRADEVIKELRTSDYEYVATLIDKSIAAAIASSLPDYDDPSHMQGRNDGETWQALQGLHGLCRVLQLVTDIEWDVDDDLANIQEDGLFYIGLAGSPNITRRNRTIARIYWDGSPSARLPAAECSCWPVTWEEWFAANSVQQSRGTVDLAACDKEGNWRFSVTSLDVHIAVQSEAQSHKAAAQAHDVKKLDKLTEIVMNDLGPKVANLELHTAGMQLIDNWRQAAVIKEFVYGVKRGEDAAGYEYYDAADLTLGFRLDVGGQLSKAPGHRAWRSLTERWVEYQLAAGTQTGEGAEAKQSQNALTQLIARFEPGDPKDKPGQGSPPPGVKESAVLAAPTRLRSNAGDATDKIGKTTAFAEPVLCCWNGDPLGMPARSMAAKVAKGGLPLNQTARLLGSIINGAEERPFKLRFGYPYAFGARSVLMGGVSISLADAEKQYEGMNSPAFPAPSDVLCRFLRQERIGAPMMAIDGNHLIGEFFSERQGLEGEQMVVRSAPSTADSSEAWRFGPNETSRVLFAPPVDISFATYHGVFDSMRAAGGKAGQNVPAGGLQQIDYDAEWGGFPVFDPLKPSKRLLRDLPKEKTDTTKDKKEKAGGKSAPQGIAAIQSRKSNRRTGQANKEYYPDPAAEFMVIALRRRGACYLSGKPICIPLYPIRKKVAERYPNAQPVIIKVRAFSPPSSSQHKHLESYDDLRRRAGLKEGSFWPTAALVEKMHVTEVTLWLSPGEEFDVETWCVPSLAHLQAWFEAPEALALLLGSAVCGEDLGKACQELCEALSIKKPVQTGKEYEIRRGNAATSWSAVKTASQGVYDALLKHPVPAIAAVRKFAVAHAVIRPPAAPSFAPDRPLAIYRCSKETYDAVVANSTLNPPRDEVGGTELLITGAAQVDGEIADTLQLRIMSARPRGGELDDVRRGRSSEQRARGSWCSIEDQKSDDAKDEYYEALFGFKVSDEGKVEWTAHKTVCAEWKISKEQTSADFLARAGSKDAISVDRVLSGPGARRVTAELAHTSRTARLVPPSKTYGSTNKDEQELAIGVDSREIAVRAVARPGAIEPKHLLPAFVWTSGENSLTRTVKIRFRFARPWYTSGQEERLGLVLWPPDLFDKDFDIRKKIGELEKGSQGLAWRDPYFSDADLGPGGEYVTRWGADPIFDAGDVSWLIPAENFRDLQGCCTGDSQDDGPAPPIDARDTDKPGRDTAKLWAFADRYKPRLVKNALMPVPETGEGKGADGATGASVAQPRFMTVSLLTVEPRFDPDFEEWYADIELDSGLARDPFVRFGVVRYQPHAARSLQVSQPSKAWIQVAGYKRVASLVDITSTQVTVCVGPVTPAELARRQSAAEPAPQPPTSVPVPHFRVTLFERRRNASGALVERPVRYLSRDGQNGKTEEATQQGPVFVSSEQMWRCCLQLPRPPSEDLTYVVHVEEFYRGEPASYAAEPSTPEAGERAQLVEGGTRFSARLELPVPAPMK